MKYLIQWVSHLQQRQKSRRQLMHLSSEQLDDIGVSVSEAVREARKPFWL